MKQCLLKQINFNTIKYFDIFNKEFQNLTQNNKIIFKNNGKQGGIAVVYAPNGTGKTSFTKLLSLRKNSNNTQFVATNEENKAIQGTDFYIIRDQICRNIIKGTTSDYLLGEEIRKETELKNQINETFEKALKELKIFYKTELGISTIDHFFINQIIKINKTNYYSEAHEYINIIINKKKQCTEINKQDFISFLKSPTFHSQKPTIGIEEDFLIKNFDVVSPLLSTSFWKKHCVNNPIVLKMEQIEDSLQILQKYNQWKITKCVICDTSIDYKQQIDNKEREANKYRSQLDKESKAILENILLNHNFVSDPFNIQNIIRDSLASNNYSPIIELNKKLHQSIANIVNLLIWKLIHCFDSYPNIIKQCEKYFELLKTKPKINSEDLLLIQNIIKENIEKEISIERDSIGDNVYLIKIGKQNLIGTEREQLELSTGEQNFISIAFELLLAKNSQKKYIVIDDPISSFDSIYKNKITFCIIKFLEKCKQILLTHNVDLLHLLDAQLSNCYNLYLLNNAENGNNGFIYVSEQEGKLLINLHNLVSFFQNKGGILKKLVTIKQQKNFFMAIIPFLRGYAHISLDKGNYFSNLSKIMHGYNDSNTQLDIAEYYNYFFSNDTNIFPEPCYIKLSDILQWDGDFDTLEVFSQNQFSEQYPLLTLTLRHTFAYYYIRLKIEYELTKIFKITIKEEKTLQEIINKAFNCDDSDPQKEDKIKRRLFFTSRKSIINEFNHYEGNISIFQPALDISKEVLNKELKDILKQLEEIKEIYSENFKHTNKTQIK